MSKYYKKTRYYVDGYVMPIPKWMTKKDAKAAAKKAQSPIFKTFERAQNYRLAGILGG